MAKEVKIGQQDYTVTVFIPDPASTDGSGKTGLNAAALTVSYTRVETDNDVTVTDVTSSLSDLSALTDAHSDWGLKEVSSTLAPGLYRLDIADAVFVTGAWSAVVYVMVTSSAASASPIEFIMVPEAPYAGVSPGPDSITEAKISDNAFANEHFAAGALTSAEITSAAGCVVASIANDAITAAAIANGAIDAATFAANAITSTVIANDAITADKINTGAIAADAFDQTAADKVWSTAARTLTANTNLGGVEVDLTKIHGTALTETAGQLAAGFVKVFDVATPVFTAESVNQTGDAYGVVNHADYGNAKLVRSTTPANTLSVDANHLVAVPDNQKVDVNTIKTATVAATSTVTFQNGTVPKTTDKMAATLATGDVTGNLPADVKVYTVQPTVTGATLDAAYDAAKTAAQAGDEMDLIDAPNGTAVTAFVTAWGTKTGAITSLAYELLMERIYQMINNKMDITELDGTLALKNIGDTGSIATGAVNSAAGHTIRSELTWA